MIISPEFNVKIEGQVSKWKLAIKKESEYKDPTDPNMERNETWVALCLSMRDPGDVSLEVEIKGIGIKIGLVDMLGKPLKESSNGQVTIASKIENLFETDQDEEDADITDQDEDIVDGDKCTFYKTYAGSTDDVLKLFDKNKISVMATVWFYKDGNNLIKQSKREKNFLTQLRSINDLESLADFTIICGDREFKCHRVLLASRSTVFKAMILNDKFMETRQNSFTIEEASPDMVEAMLEFISTGRVPDDIQEKAIDLINLADSYDLQDLMELCESSLINNLTVEVVIETLIAIDLHAPNSLHRQKILDFIKKEAAQVVKSSHWKEFVVKYPDLVTEIVLSLSSHTI